MTEEEQIAKLKDALIKIQEIAMTEYKGDGDHESLMDFYSNLVDRMSNVAFCAV
jgi:hypothetical protein